MKYCRFAANDSFRLGIINSQVAENRQIAMDLFLQMLMNRQMATGYESEFPFDRLSLFTNRQYLLHKHELSLTKLQQQQSRLGYGNTLSTTGTHITAHRPDGGRNYHVDIVDLNVVDVDDLISAVDQIPTGKFFLCRIIAPWMKIVAIETIVEDVKGEKAVRLAVYNASTVLKTKLHVGTILAIKNPWFKSTSDMGFSIRVDNPMDIIYDMSILGKLNMEWKGQIPVEYRSLKPAPLSQEERKQLGNAAFVKKNYDEARHYYSEGLKEFPDDIDFLSNRAATFLHLRRFSLALADVQSVLSANENHSKAIYRKTKALCGLGKYVEAQSFVKERVNTAFCKKIELENLKELQKLVKHVDSLVHQFKTGEYDILELLEKHDSKYLDVADYTGNVKVIPIEGKGRGLVANKNFSPGDLILANRAIEMVFPDEMDDGVICGFGINLVDNTGHDESHTRLVAKLVQLLNDEPEHLTEVYNLYAGQNFTEMESSETMVDVRRLHSVCNHNCFKKENGTVGLWNLPSFMNHSCVDYNARWSIIGDFIFVRAVSPIAKGEEIVISYIIHSRNSKAKNALLRSFSFCCNCTLCQAENAIGESSVKKADVIENEGLEHWTVKQVRKAIQELEKTTSNNKLLNLSHNLLYARLANVYSSLKDFKSSLIVWKKLYDDLKDTPFISIKVMTASHLCDLAENGIILPGFPLEWCKNEFNKNLSILVGNSNVPKLISVYSYIEISSNVMRL